jgi:hypothetical protein
MPPELDNLFLAVMVISGLLFAEGFSKTLVVASTLHVSSFWVGLLSRRLSHGTPTCTTGAFYRTHMCYIWAWSIMAATLGTVELSAINCALSARGGLPSNCLYFVMGCSFPRPLCSAILVRTAGELRCPLFGASADDSDSHHNICGL